MPVAGRHHYRPHLMPPRPVSWRHPRKTPRRDDGMIFIEAGLTSSASMFDTPARPSTRRRLSRHQMADSAYRLIVPAAAIWPSSRRKRMR